LVKRVKENGLKKSFRATPEKEEIVPLSLETPISFQKNLKVLNFTPLPFQLSDLLLFSTINPSGKNMELTAI
jgi:hypothetical protein